MHSIFYAILMDGLAKLSMNVDIQEKKKESVSRGFEPATFSFTTPNVSAERKQYLNSMGPNALSVSFVISRWGQIFFFCSNADLRPKYFFSFIFFLLYIFYWNHRKKYFLIVCIENAILNTELNFQLAINLINEKIIPLKNQ